MKRLQPVILVLVLLLFPVQLFADVQGFARLVLIEGDVQIRVADTDDWVPAAVNTPLYEGDSIWTPVQSRTELQLHDGTVIRLDSRSSLSILKVEEEALQFHLGMGRIYVRTGDTKRWSMQFDLEDSTVKIIDKARLRLEITEQGEEEISVYRGSAYVESYSGKTRVRKGEMLSVEDARAEISPVNPPDSWDKWNTSRDNRSAQRTGSGGHLPEELVIYEDELASAGEWQEVQEYGRVWRPALGAEIDWAPYRSGRWVWRGGDYVWVSSEPWGWAPYHYGRWTVVTGFGWCWVPPLPGDVFWAPGFVGWITTPSFVGWVPLAPGEIYYGRRHYGRDSVTVTNVTNITVANTVNVYRNSGHRQAVTSVDRNAFVSGKGRYSTRSADLFKKERVTVGRPEPRPRAREVLMPQVRTIPAANLPPPEVAKLPVRQLKERFPRVDRGGEFIPQRDKNRPAGIETSPRDKQGQSPAMPGTGTSTRGAASGRPPMVIPVAPQAAETKKPPRNLPAVERKGPEQGHHEQPANETGSKMQLPAVKQSESRPPEIRPAVPPRSRPAEVQGDRKVPAAGQGAGRRDQGTKAPEKTTERRDGGSKAAAPPERKATNVWKITPKEESQPAKEKK